MVRLPARSAACVALLAAVLSLFLPSALARPQDAAQDRTYLQQIERWRADRAAELRADDGWLTLVGLHWLREGANTIGAGDTNGVPLPDSVPARLGTLVLDKDTVRFTPAPVAGLLINGKPAVAQVLAPQPGPYDVVSMGSVTWFVIKRGDRFGVRVRDRNSPARRDFAGLHWFPVRESFRLRARFVTHRTPTSIMIANVLGAVDPWPSPGYAEFSVGGQVCRLHAVLDGPDSKELFFIFRDQTTGKETYPGGRFLYAEMPVNGEVLLDFNKAHSPPCAFTPFATCPLPPKENHVAVRIEAGELDPHR